MKYKILITICTLILAGNLYGYSPTPVTDDGDNQHYISDGNGGLVVDNDFDGIADSEKELPTLGTDECVDWLMDNNPDALTVDSDKDDMPNACDNCKYISNPNQEDANKDGVGDACKGNIDAKPEEIVPADDPEEAAEEEEKEEEKEPANPFLSSSLRGDAGCNMATTSSANMVILLLSSIFGIASRRFKKN